MLKKELFTDADPRWPEERTKHLTAGSAARTLPKGITGAGGYGSKWDLLRWYIDPVHRENEAKKLENNEHVARGLKYQVVGAAAYSLVTGMTLTPLGFVKGEGLEDFLSVTYDYVCLEEPIIVEVKCPNQQDAQWKEKYWVQCQLQLHLAGFEKLHLVMFFPRSEHKVPQVIIKEITRDNRWFLAAMPHFENFWRLVTNYKKGEPPAMYVEQLKKFKSRKISNK